MFITKKQFEIFKHDLEYQLWGNENPPVGECYWREIINLKDRIERLEEESLKFYGKQVGLYITMTGDMEQINRKNGLWNLLLEHLGLEYYEGKGFRKIKKGR